MTTKNIFVVALDDFNLRHMKTIRNAENYNFRSLLSQEDVLERDYYPIEQILEKAFHELDNFDGSIDAIIGHYDFPVSTMLPVLREHCGLPGPTLESVLKCEHKYWSRLVQSDVVPEHVPEFAEVNPFDEDPFSKIDLEFPFWLKPVKSFSSYLGFRIKNKEDFYNAIEKIRNGISRFAKPLNYFLDRAELPPRVREVDGSHCVAESIISGEQCTLEGFVFNGEVHVYGVVDSLREANESSFSRYQYPSLLPQEIKDEMVRTATKILEHIGFDNSPFNMELFWDKKNDRLWLLEINPRISKSHCPLFEKVEGASHHEVAVEVALGIRPDFPRKAGDFDIAGKFFLREFGDAHVERVPSEEDIARIKADLPGTDIKIPVREGMELSDLKDQDSYSHNYAIIFLGGKDQQELEQKYEQCVERLPFSFSSEPVAT